jgi:uncharacterized membrane protein
MTKFIAAIFESPAKAEEGKRILLNLDCDHTISICSLSVISRDSTGALIVLEPAAKSQPGEALRAIVAQLDRVCRRQPAPLGLITDLGGWADLVDFGVTPDFIEKIAAELSPCKAAVLGEIDEDWITPLDTFLEEIGGFVIRTWRSDFEAEQLARKDNTKPDGDHQS